MKEFDGGGLCVMLGESLEQAEFVMCSGVELTWLLVFCQLPEGL